MKVNMVNLVPEGWGSVLEVFDHPYNVFVAGFIGMPQMNLFEGKLKNTKNGGYVVEVGGAQIPVGEEIAKGLAKKGHVWADVLVGIRPEHILLKAEGEDVIKGKVDVSEMMGSEIHLHVAAAGKDVVVRVPTVDLSSDKRGGFAYGSDFNFTFRPDQIHLFDPASERNLLPLQK